LDYYKAGSSRSSSKNANAKNTLTERNEGRQKKRIANQPPGCRHTHSSIDVDIDVDRNRKAAKESGFEKGVVGAVSGAAALYLVDGLARGDLVDIGHYDEHGQWVGAFPLGRKSPGDVEAAEQVTELTVWLFYYYFTPCLSFSSYQRLAPPRLRLFLSVISTHFHETDLLPHSHLLRTK
jgi:hypothetical protein